MNMRRPALALLLLLVCLLVPAASALGQTEAPAKAAGFRAEYLAQLDDTEKKVMSLAEAIPADKYAWRPSDGVRSVSEVFVHLGGGNFLFMNFLGYKPPMPLDMSMEKTVTEKAKVVSFLKDSFAQVRKGVQSMSDADLDKQVKFFGRENTARFLLMIAANHQHEHMGQSIAYARHNGITPPWTAEREMQKKAAPPKKDG